MAKTYTVTVGEHTAEMREMTGRELIGVKSGDFDDAGFLRMMVEHVDSHTFPESDLLDLGYSELRTLAAAWAKAHEDTAFPTTTAKS